MTARLLITFLLIIILPLINGCQRNHNQQEIVSAMQEYDRLLVSMHTDSIAQLYSPDGELGEIAKGRDSISRFLKKFAEYRVISNHSVTTQIEMNGDNATQKGHYTQVTVLPTKDTARLSGQFTTNWIWLSTEGWRIKKMETMPDK